MAAQLPSEFLDLFEKKSIAHLATIMPDGTPQVTPVWVDRDGDRVVVNSAEGRVKTRNMDARPQVGIEVMDPDNHMRYVSIRGQVVERVGGDEAEAHIHKLAQRYLERDRYPDSFRAPDEQRVFFRIEPEHVYAFDPFAGR